MIGQEDANRKMRPSNHDQSPHRSWTKSAVSFASVHAAHVYISDKTNSLVEEIRIAESTLNLVGRVFIAPGGFYFDGRKDSLGKQVACTLQSRLWTLFNALCKSFDGSPSPLIGPSIEVAKLLESEQLKESRASVPKYCEWQMNRGEMDPEVLQPGVNLLESMRSVGYSLEASIADLIDNSITATAKHIVIDADVVDGKYVAILDDGCGMTPRDAREALRLAGTLGDRKESDLGRFGLGLKTASLSQARCLTLITKRGGMVTALRWDIDFVHKSGQWLLIVLDETDIRGLPLWAEFDAQPTGTLVLWNELDLLLGDTISPGSYLAERLGGVRSSLSLVFHRFLADRRDRITITVNGIALRSIDPFLSDNPKTQRTAPESLRIGGDEVRVEGFTLPHPSGLTTEERQRPDLREGMREAQGFYVYRNRRLISHGHWYGLARMNELSKQTRVQVDVPSTLDALWQLDIKKSRAEPPQSFKLRLRQLIDPILNRGRKVHAFRGRRENTEVAHVWTKLKTRDGFGYEVNLESPLVESVLSRLATDDAERVVGLLQTIASTFPLMDAYVEVAANVPSVTRKPEREALITSLQNIRRSGLFSTDPEIALTQLANVEPFNSYNDLSTLVYLVWKDADAAE